MTKVPEKFSNRHRIAPRREHLPRASTQMVSFILSVVWARLSGIPSIEHLEIILYPELCHSHSEELEQEKSKGVGGDPAHQGPQRTFQSRSYKPKTGQQSPHQPPGQRTGSPNRTFSSNINFAQKNKKEGGKKNPSSEFNITVGGKERKKGLAKVFCFYLVTDFSMQPEKKKMWKRIK